MKENKENKEKNEDLITNIVLISGVVFGLIITIYKIIG